MRNGFLTKPLHVELLRKGLLFIFIKDRNETFLSKLKEKILNKLNI